MNSGLHLIDDALKMISGCIIPSSAIINSGSLSTTYLGSVLANSHVSSRVDCITRVKSSSSSDVLSDVHHHQFDDLTACAFATTLFPVSAIFNSCFRHQNSNAATDSTLCQSTVLTFGAGNCCTVFKSCNCVVLYC